MSQEFLNYYAVPAIQERMREYIGAARFIVDHTPDQGADCQPLAPHRLAELLSRGGEAHRSLWDSQGLLAHLDLEYVHYDDPLYPYQNLRRCYNVQQPVVRVLEELLESYEIPFIHVYSGRGHHFTWTIDRHSVAFESLCELGYLSSSLETFCAQAQPRLERSDALAFSGLGMVLEFLGHRVLGELRSYPLPLQLASIEVEPGPFGREAVCLDLSAFGDPLHKRTLRLPFSLYRKAEKWGHVHPLVCLPQEGLDLAGMLELRNDLNACGDWAAQVRTPIPEAGSGMLRLIQAYDRSRLAEVHRQFYSEFSDERTYPLTSLDALPPCIRRSLADPNDLLLKPAALQNLVRLLLTKGWRISEVTRLVRSRLEADHGWRPGVHFHESSSRAEFYTRLFGGLLKVGRDDLSDFTCPSMQWRGYCSAQECGFDLGQAAARWLRSHRYD